MPEYVTITGLCFDIFGVVLLFRNAPEKFADPQWSAFFAVEGESKRRREEWLRLQPGRKRKAAISVALIVVGFAFQIGGEVLALCTA